MEVFLSILALTWGVLNIILFFKIWEMTSDVKAIKDYFVKNNDNVVNKPVFTDNVVNKPVFTTNQALKAGDIVMHESYPKEMRVYKINSNGMCICLDNKNDNMVGTFNCKELKIKKQ